jgi:hypothetical protein
MVGQSGQIANKFIADFGGVNSAIPLILKYVRLYVGKPFVTTTCCFSNAQFKNVGIRNPDL